MSPLNFIILAFCTNFCPIKTDLSGNTVWPQASGFQKLAKMEHFWHFSLTFVHSKCKQSSLCSHCYMRLFLSFSNIMDPKLKSILNLLEIPVRTFPCSILLISDKLRQIRKSFPKSCPCMWSSGTIWSGVVSTEANFPYPPRKVCQFDYLPCCLTALWELGQEFHETRVMLELKVENTQEVA